MSSEDYDSSFLAGRYHERIQKSLFRKRRVGKRKTGSCFPPTFWNPWSLISSIRSICHRSGTRWFVPQGLKRCRLQKHVNYSGSHENTFTNSNGLLWHEDMLLCWDQPWDGAPSLHWTNKLSTSSLTEKLKKPRSQEKNFAKRFKVFTRWNAHAEPLKES